MSTHSKQPPKAVGLYDPRFEHDACGVGMVPGWTTGRRTRSSPAPITALENSSTAAPRGPTRGPGTARGS